MLEMPELGISTCIRGVTPALEKKAAGSNAGQTEPAKPADTAHNSCRIRSFHGVYHAGVEHMIKTNTNSGVCIKLYSIQM